jgi:hypothetical protein
LALSWPLDVTQIRLRAGLRAHGRHGPAHDLNAFEMIGELDQRGRRQHIHVLRGPGGLTAAFARTDQAMAAGVGGDCGRQDASDRGDPAVERQFAENGVILQSIRWDRPDRRHDANRNRQIVMAPLFRQIGRCKIDRDALCRQSQTRDIEGGAHPLARFGNRFVAQADDIEE